MSNIRSFASVRPLSTNTPKTASANTPSSNTVRWP